MLEPAPDRGTEIEHIPVGAGLESLVDASDFVKLSQTKWYPRRTKGGRIYAQASDGTLAMHRVILECGPGEQGDHINGNTLDNRRCNLRKATPSQNSQNAKVHGDNQTGYKGIFWGVKEQRWRAVIWIKGQGKLHLGAFDSQSEAAHAYDEAAKRHFGEFARLNFP